MVVFDDMESTEKVRIYDKAAERQGYESYGESITLRFGDVVIPHISPAEPLRLECQHFIDCVRSRRKTVAPVEVAVMSDTITQLSMIAILTGRKIRWDPVKEAILDDPAAEQLLTRAMRSPWHL